MTSARELLRRIVQVLPNGPLLDYRQTFGERELKAPDAAGTLGAKTETGGGQLIQIHV